MFSNVGNPSADITAFRHAPKDAKSITIKNGKLVTQGVTSQVRTKMFRIGV